MFESAEVGHRISKEDYLAREATLREALLKAQYDLLANAQAKRLRKNVPLLVGNIGPDTFGQDHNTLLLIDSQGATEMPRASKLTLARQLVTEIANRIHKA